MPKLMPSEVQRREKALQRAIARAQVDLGLPSDQDVSDLLGLSQSAYSKRKKEPYRSYGFESAARMVRRLQFTGRELCEIFGVPYTPAREE